MPRGRVTALAGALVLCVTSTAAPQPGLDEVLNRLDAYLIAYEDVLSAVVAEEHYRQVLETEDGQAVRELKSDYALARASGGQTWTGFRDTYDVDGRPVRDRADRLLDLLADGSATSARQALRISRENARYNLGEDIVSRTINVPTVAVDLIHPRHRDRFSFRKRGEEVVDGTEAWVLSYQERKRPTIMRTPDGGNRRARGRVWVDPSTGAVLRTDLSWEGAPEGFIVVHYRRDANVNALVPETMLEEYRGAKGLITGRATYTNYRRFQTAARLVPSVH